MPPIAGAQKLLKPAEFAENQLLEAILDNTYGPGDVLPAERILARFLGVTRPTLRETLQRLSKEGWVTIAHGKPTRELLPPDSWHQATHQTKIQCEIIF